jgi:radical SAM superfamily enzyme with C-terminal helix-hairpin-helix motif
MTEYMTIDKFITFITKKIPLDKRDYVLYVDNFHMPAKELTEENFVINDRCKTIDIVGTPHGYEPNLKELSERVDRLGSDAMSDSIVRSEIEAQISKLQRMI